VLMALLGSDNVLLLVGGGLWIGVGLLLLCLLSCWLLLLLLLWGLLGKEGRLDLYYFDHYYYYCYYYYYYYFGHYCVIIGYQLVMEAMMMMNY